MSMPQPGQKAIPLKDWRRFLRVADWWDRTHGHRVPGVLRPNCGQIHEGKLDADLDHDDTTGVTVTIWRGNPQIATQDKINVLPPIVMTSGTLTSGDPVIIQRIDGHWRVTHAEC